MSVHKPLMLASTSRYRAELLGRLQLPFATVAPACSEAALPGESCTATATRLAIAKARDGVSIATKDMGWVDGVVIGSDQVADMNGVALGKPGTRQRAFLQLQSMRGQTVIFHTALALIDIASGRTQSQLVATTVTMRHYSDAQIGFYLDHEDVLDCAGSAKSEGLGAALIAGMTSDDPTALIGLPLIALTTMLYREGIEVLS